MLDIGAMELFVVAVLALVVVGPQELPKLLRTVGGFMRKARELAAEFRSGVEDLAAEVEREVDPFKDLREEEGLRPGMSPGEITEHILSNREADMVDEAAKSASDQQKLTDEPEKSEEKPAKIESKPAKSEPKAGKSESKSAKSEPGRVKTEFLEGQHDMFGSENADPSDPAANQNEKSNKSAAEKPAKKPTKKSTQKPAKKSTPNKQTKKLRGIQHDAP